MTPLTRRGFLGVLAAIPFLRRFAPLTATTERITPLVIGEVQRDMLTLPYWRAYEEGPNGKIRLLQLIQSFDQDAELIRQESLARSESSDPSASIRS